MVSYWNCKIAVFVWTKLVDQKGQNIEHYLPLRRAFLERTLHFSPLESIGFYNLLDLPIGAMLWTRGNDY